MSCFFHIEQRHDAKYYAKLADYDADCDIPLITAVQGHIQIGCIDQLYDDAPNQRVLFILNTGMVIAIANANYASIIEWLDDMWGV